jgi:hypothetical protein
MADDERDVQPASVRRRDLDGTARDRQPPGQRYSAGADAEERAFGPDLEPARGDESHLPHEREQPARPEALEHASEPRVVGEHGVEAAKAREAEAAAPEVAVPELRDDEHGRDSAARLGEEDVEPRERAEERPQPAAAPPDAVDAAGERDRSGREEELLAEDGRQLRFARPEHVGERRGAHRASASCNAARRCG